MAPHEAHELVYLHSPSQTMIQGLGPQGLWIAPQATNSLCGLRQSVGGADRKCHQQSEAPDPPQALQVCFAELLRVDDEPREALANDTFQFGQNRRKGGPEPSAET